ncbi:MAG: hypothetical protein ABIO17_06130 [Pseudoxanthomonas sp.]
MHHDCLHAVVLSRLVQANALDAAIEAGLMVFVPCPDCEQTVAALLRESQRTLSMAWAARDRYLARKARLSRRAAQRDARRAAIQVAPKTPLSPVVAAVLARAKARAAERGAK